MCLWVRRRTGKWLTEEEMAEEGTGWDEWMGRSQIMCDTEGRVNAKWTGDWWVGGEEDTERWAGWLQIDKKSMSGQICRH